MNYTQWQSEFPRSYFQSFSDDGENGKIVLKPLCEVGEQEARELNKNGAGIYFTPNGFTTWNGRNEKFCDKIEWWFVDIEGYPKEEQMKEIRKYDNEPTMVIETKNGYHCYWKIEGVSPNWYKIIDNLIEHFGSDMAISSTNEVLRIPGFNHLKDPKDPFEIKLINKNNNAYTEDEMMIVCPEKQIVRRLDSQMEDYHDDMDEIKAIPIRAVLDKLGVRHERNVIFENGKKTSASIHPKENYIHRFSSKPGSGTVIDAVLTWGRESEVSGAIQWLRQEFGIARRELKRKAETPMYQQVFDDAGKQAFDVMRKMEDFSNQDVIKFHLTELNELLMGIYPSDLTVIGADTGTGKSQFLSDLAFNAAQNGKRVAYFDLENDDGDFIRRQVAKKASIKLNRMITVNHLKTRDILEDPNMSGVIHECFESVHNTVSGNVFMYNNHKIPTIEDFLQAIKAIREGKGVDLILIDHLHYFEMDNKDASAIHLGKIMRELRMLTKKEEIPVVLASHLRGRQGERNKEPDNFSLFGSSNISKEASNVVLFWLDEEQTKMKITKGRNATGQRRCFEGTYDPISRQIDFNPSFQ